jgi:hypothetical protein
LRAERSAKLTLRGGENPGTLLTRSFAVWTVIMQAEVSIAGKMGATN